MKLNELMNLKPLKYSDWFGSGTLQNDAMAEVKRKKGEEPINIYLEGDATGDDDRWCGRMMILEFSDEFAVVGYDGNEYWHSYYFPKVR